MQSRLLLWLSTRFHDLDFIDGPSQDVLLFFLELLAVVLNASHHLGDIVVGRGDLRAAHEGAGVVTHLGVLGCIHVVGCLQKVPSLTCPASVEFLFAGIVEVDLLPLHFVVVLSLLAQAHTVDDFHLDEALFEVDLVLQLLEPLCVFSTWVFKA